MSSELTLLVVLLAIILVHLVRNLWRYDMVAVGAMLLVAITGLVPHRHVVLTIPRVLRGLFERDPDRVANPRAVS